MTTVSTAAPSDANAAANAIDESLVNANPGEFNILGAYLVKFSVYALPPQIVPPILAANATVYRVGHPDVPIAHVSLLPAHLTQTVQVGGIPGGWYGTLTFTLSESAETLTVAYALSRATFPPQKKTGTLVYHWK